MKGLLAYAVYVKKLASYGAGLVAALVAAGVLHGQALVAAEGFIAVATGLGIYKAKNGSRP